ncbi:MAG: hypothetical protein WC783_00115 [Candidatus Paceibacterota bacterium]|jgi:hypothetical protein
MIDKDDITLIKDELRTFALETQTKAFDLTDNIAIVYHLNSSELHRVNTWLREVLENKVINEL